MFREVVVTRCFGGQFNFDYQVTMLIVSWALGWAMIVLSALVWLPAFLATTFGVVMIIDHNLFDSVQSSSRLWSILHSPNFVMADPQHFGGRLRSRPNLWLGIRSPEGSFFCALASV
jgi:uncharacterized membrane protein